MITVCWAILKYAISAGVRVAWTERRSAGRALLAAAAAVPVAAMLKAAPAKARHGRPAGALSTCFDQRAGYLPFGQKDGVHVARDIWRREVRFKTVGSVRKLRIVQRCWGWDELKALRAGHVRCSDGDLAASSLRVTTVEDKETVEGFCSPDRITGLPRRGGQQPRRFRRRLPDRCSTSETDLEMLGTLPLAHGYRNRSFYHPQAGGPPARYICER